jgi:hypothetical protein
MSLGIAERRKPRAPADSEIAFEVYPGLREQRHRQGSLKPSG